MQHWAQIRRRVLVEGVSKRQIRRETGLHRDTLNKILAHAKPPGYQRSQPRASLLDPHRETIERILEEDRQLPRNQRHTAKLIWHRLQREGFTGSYTIVKDAVRELRRTRQEVFVPLRHDPGEAQVDFGHALANIGGVLQKVAFFAMVLPYSDACFVMAFERECTETFWEGHVRAFEYFGGVPQRIRYDNSKVMVRRIVGARQREVTQGFAQLASHYLFAHEFCQVRRANEKGVVEGIVKFARLNFFVPVPQRQNVLLVGNSGTGKTHLACALAFSACTQGRRVRFFTVSGLVTQLAEAQEERGLQRMLGQLERHDLLVLDELGYVPFSRTGAELLFDVISRCYERVSLIVTTNLPFEQWTEVCGSERLTGAILDRLTHHVHILEANGESYRLKDSKRRRKGRDQTNR